MKDKESLELPYKKKTKHIISYLFHVLRNLCDLAFMVFICGIKGQRTSRDSLK